MKDIKKLAGLKVSERQLLDLLNAINFKWPAKLHNAPYIAQDHDGTLRLFYSIPSKDKGDIGLNLTNVVERSDFIIENVGVRINYWYRAYTTRQQYLSYRKEKGDDKSLRFNKSKLKTIVEFNYENLDDKNIILEELNKENSIMDSFYYHGLTRDEKSLILESIITKSIFYVSISMEKYLRRACFKVTLCNYHWQIFDKRIKYVAVGKGNKLILSSSIIVFNKSREKWEPLDGCNSKPEVFIDIPYTEFIECASKLGIDESLLHINFNEIIPEYSLTKRPEGK